MIQPAGRVTSFRSSGNSQTRCDTAGIGVLEQGTPSSTSRRRDTHARRPPMPADQGAGRRVDADGRAPFRARQAMAVGMP